MYIPSVWLQSVGLNSGFILKVQELGFKRTLGGTIKKIVRNVDSASQSVLVYGRIGSNNQLFSGMSGIASFNSLNKGQE